MYSQNLWNRRGKASRRLIQNVIELKTDALVKLYSWRSDSWPSIWSTAVFCRVSWFLVIAIEICWYNASEGYISSWNWFSTSSRASQRFSSSSCCLTQASWSPNHLKLLYFSIFEEVSFQLSVKQIKTRKIGYNFIQNSDLIN